MTAWLALWKRSLDIAGGAPEVIAHRSAALRDTPWDFDTFVEANRMVAEKMAATNEAWHSLWRNSLAWRWPFAMSWPPAGFVLPPADWVPPHSQAVRAAERALKPYARRVKANQARLRRKAVRHK